MKSFDPSSVSQSAGSCVSFYITLLFYHTDGDVFIYRQGIVSSLPICSSGCANSLQSHLFLLDGHSLSSVEHPSGIRCRISKRETKVNYDVS